MLKNFVPVLIPTLNRFNHFKRCVNSLLECELCEETDLYIALDYPLRDNHWEGYNRILEYIGHIRGFKSVCVIRREFNLGAHRNMHESLGFLFQKHETVIFTEDDNIFSKDFLLFMNRCLKAYKDDENIFSISGYNYPMQIPKSYRKEIYLWQGFSAWGVGFWRDKYYNIEWNENLVHKNINKFLKNYYNVIKFNEIANNYVPALVYMNSERLMHSDIIICMHQFLNNMHSVFPVMSRVRNLGNDGSGENCSSLDDDFFAKQEIYKGSSDYVIDNSIRPNLKINKILKIYFHRPWKIQFVFFLNLLFSNLGVLKGFNNNKN